MTPRANHPSLAAGTGRRRRAWAVALAVIVVSAGCSRPASGGPTVERTSVDGQAVVAVSTSRSPRAIVLYLHGLGGGADDVVGNSKMRPVATAFVDAGYAVVGSDAGGDSYGNPASRTDYADAVRWARSRYGDRPLVMLAESMGGLAMLPLISSGSVPDVRAALAVSPALTLNGYQRSSFAPGIRSAWGSKVPQDPMVLPVAGFAHEAFRFYVADDDTVAPTSTNAGAFAARLDGVAKVELVHCRGGHVSLACYQPADAVRWVGQRLRA